jgi:hypothetical protein
MSENIQKESGCVIVGKKTTEGCYPTPIKLDKYVKNVGGGAMKKTRTEKL